MKTLAIALLMTAGLVGCKIAGAEIQVVRVDAGRILWIAIKGAAASAIAPRTSAAAGAGEVIHRVLEGPDRRVLFAYDVQVRKSAGGCLFRLIPAGRGPTFARIREVEARDGETVSVELLANPATGDTVVDGLRSWEPVPLWETLGTAFRGFFQTR